ncbi:MAG: hypothetical protein K9H26_06800, partial [Prolixibacteraceae bacterium]|nr:hypothetical protein [Prolixibacteraceae bacterium]
FGPFVHEGTDGSSSSLKYIITPEGRILNKGTDTSPIWDWEYYLKDHLGNVRVVIAPTEDAGYSAVQQETHYYPYGMRMSQLSNSANSTNDWLFSSKQLESNFELGWYSFGARNNYDPALIIWRSVDPRAEKYYSLSPFSYCANNPILLVDPEGDTIRVAESLLDNEMAYRAYQTFINSEEGASFVKLFETSGKYGDIVVTFGADTEKTEGASGDTRMYVDEEEAAFNGEMENNQNLSFEVNINPGTMTKEGNDGFVNGKYGTHTKKSAARSNYQRTLNKAKSLLHESQHVEIMTRDMKDDGKYDIHPYYQHQYMKDTKLKYCWDRLRFYQKRNIYNVPYDPNSFED